MLKLLSLQEQYNYVNSLNKRIKISIENWSDDMSKYLSSYLIGNKRNQKGTTVKLMKRIKIAYNNIELAFRHVPLTQKPITVYHGFTSNTFLPKVLKFKNFIATSLIIDVAINFTYNSPCCLLEIKVLPGSKILPIIDISHSEEAEIILYKGMFRQYKSPIFINKIYYDYENDNEVKITLKKYYVEYISD